MIPKSEYRFKDKIILQQYSGAGMTIRTKVIPLQESLAGPGTVESEHQG
jgi:hypothetical protein